MEYQDQVASIVHDVKNRLQLTMSSVEVLNQHPDDRVQQSGRHISRELDEVNQQLVMLLSLYRLGSTELVSLDEVHVFDIFESLQERIQYDELTITCEANLTAFADSRLLHAVIGDALHNAIRHCQKAVTLTARTSGRGVVVRVCDDGNDGGDDITSKPEFGSGVGLWIANKIAKAHQHKGKCGYAKFETNDSQGSVFELYIP